jgi:cytochrome c oxidase assembly protein subunit 15
VVAERFAWGVVGYNVLVIVWGALVRATGSGAGCGNHWPLCNGQVIPVSPGLHTVIEFTHRSMTGGATLAVLGMLLLVFRATHKGDRARVAAVWSAVLLFNEALLGALLVKLGYVTDNRSLGRVVVLAVHLSNTLLLLGSLTLTAVLLKARRQRGELLLNRTDIPVAAAALLATLVVGVSGSLAALGDTLFPSASLRAAVAADFASGSPALLRVRWVHPASAVVATIFVGWLLLRALRTAQAAPAARTVVGLLVLQFVLGIADVLLLAPVPLQLLHLLGADLFWVALVTVAANLAMQREAAPESVRAGWVAPAAEGTRLR